MVSPGFLFFLGPSSWVAFVLTPARAFYLPPRCLVTLPLQFPTLTHYPTFPCALLPYPWWVIFRLTPTSRFGTGLTSIPFLPTGVVVYTFFTLPANFHCSLYLPTCLYPLYYYCGCLACLCCPIPLGSFMLPPPLPQQPLGFPLLVPGLVPHPTFLLPPPLVPHLPIIFTVGLDVTPTYLYHIAGTLLPPSFPSPTSHPFFPHIPCDPTVPHIAIADINIFPLVDGPQFNCCPYTVP